LAVVNGGVALRVGRLAEQPSAFEVALRGLQPSAGLREVEVTEEGMRRPSSTSARVRTSTSLGRSNPMSEQCARCARRTAFSSLSRTTTNKSTSLSAVGLPHAREPNT
jgi:hypothetical protein